MVTPSVVFWNTLAITFRDRVPLVELYWRVGLESALLFCGLVNNKQVGMMWARMTSSSIRSTCKLCNRGIARYSPNRENYLKCRIYGDEESELVQRTELRHTGQAKHRHALSKGANGEVTKPAKDIKYYMYISYQLNT